MEKDVVMSKKLTRELRFVLVRSANAGVHFGYLKSESADGTRVDLMGARRIWQWFGAKTLSEVSQSGIDTEKSKVSCEVPEITVTGVCEIHTVSCAAKCKLECATWK